MSKSKFSDYPFTIRQLLKDEGDGYLIEFPDLPGCISDGNTIDEAIKLVKMPLAHGLRQQKKPEKLFQNLAS